MDISMICKTPIEGSLYDHDYHYELSNLNDFSILYYLSSHNKLTNIYNEVDSVTWIASMT